MIYIVLMLILIILVILCILKFSFKNENYSTNEINMRYNYLTPDNVKKFWDTINYIKIYNKKANRINNPLYIPKQIFQTVSDKKNIHKEIQKNIENIKNQNPDWKYTLFDDKDIIEYIKKNYDSETLRVYNKINPEYGPCKADFFRYLLMYKEGGVYLDIKSYIAIPLKDIIKYDDEYILCHWHVKTKEILLKNTYGEYQQWHIICKPKHPFLKEVIKNVTNNILSYDKDKDGTGKFAVLNITGPLVYTRTILGIQDKYKHTLYLKNQHIGLVYSFFHDETSHFTKYEKKHYTELTSPIIF